jgi:transcriptional regulator with XRE-family HTH domain
MSDELEPIESAEGRNWKQDKAIELWCTNANMRAEDIAEQVGVSVRTVHRWKRDPDFVDKLVRASRSVFFSALPELYEVAVKKALTGDWRFMKLIFDHIEKIEELNKDIVMDHGIVIQWKSNNNVSV